MTDDSKPAFDWHVDLVARTFPNLIWAEYVADVAQYCAAMQDLSIPYTATQVAPGEWQQSRSAISALRRAGVAGLPAVFGVAAWTVNCYATATSTVEQYTVRDAMLALSHWRTLKSEVFAGVDSAGRPHAASTRPPERMAKHLSPLFDDCVANLARDMMAGPTSAAQRGALRYLELLEVDLDATLASITAFLDREGPSGDADYTVTRSGAISLLQRLAERKRAAQSAPDVETAAVEEAIVVGDAPSPHGMRSRLLRELGSGSPSSRQAALQALVQLGLWNREAGGVAFDLLDQLNDVPGNWGSLRANLIRTLASNSPQLISGTDHEDRSAQAVELLLDVVAEDATPEVRATALLELGSIAADDERVWVSARACLQDSSPVVRLAAVRALARCGSFRRPSRT